MIPKRRQRPRMGLRVIVDKVFMRHRKWTKGFGCSVPGCLCTDIEFCHARNAANSGTGSRPHDGFGWPGCSAHHREQHRIGQPAFERKYGISLFKIAGWHMRNSPDLAMRESFRQLPDHVQRPLLEAA